MLQELAFDISGQASGDAAGTGGQKRLLPQRLRPGAERPSEIQEVCVHFAGMEEEEELHWASSSAASGWGIPSTPTRAGLTSSSYSAT